MKASIAALAALTIATFGCASDAPSRELKNARTAYTQARTGDAARYAPDTLVDAERALRAAERAHDDDARSDIEKSRAYVAQRKAELAMTHGAIGRERREQAQAEKEYAKLQDTLRTQAQQKLVTTQGQLQRQTEQTQNAQSETQREREARLQADERARAAMQSLEQVAQVQEESRGTVITLSGQVLFVTGKSDLLPAAKNRLDDVAKALVDSGEDRPIIVEGYTDSRGSEDKNMELSQARAEAVVAYLITKGVKPTLIKAEGKGENQPIASNDTAEGRANNRRVEIVLGQRSGPSSPGMTPASGTGSPRSPSTSTPPSGR